MASQAAVKRAKTQTEGPEKVERKPRIFDYSKYRQSIQNTEEFLRYWLGYPDKSGLMAYVYRLVPKVDFSLVGIEVNNILETTELEKCTPAAMASKFGRGKYMVKLNDSNRADGQKEVCKGWIRLEDEEKPPVYDVRTLVLSHPDNIDEVNRQIALGALVRDSSGAPRVRTVNDAPAVAQPAGAAAPVQPAGGGSDLLSRDVLGQVLMKLVTNASQSPGESVKQALDVARMLTPQQPAVSVEQIVESVVTRLRGTSGPADLFSSYERVDSFIQKVRGPVAGVAAGGGDSAGGWAAAAPQILAQLNTLVPMIFGGLEKLQASRMPPAGRPRAAEPAGPVVVEPARPQQPEMTIADRIAEIAKVGFQKMSEGVRGLDYAAYICNYEPGALEIYRMLEPGGTLGVMGLAAMNPATASFLTDLEKRAQVEIFLDDFFSYDPDGGAAGVEEVPGASVAPNGFAAGAGA